MRKRWKLLVAACIIIILLLPGLLKNSIVNNIKEGTLIKEYQGVVARIKYIKGNRGMPILVFSDSTQVELDVIDEKVAKFVMRGDSIVKHKGKLSVVIYRRTLESMRDTIKVKFE